MANIWGKQGLGETESGEGRREKCWRKMERERNLRDRIKAL